MNQTSPPVSETVAAVDLGSNSFHMIVGKLDNRQLVIVDRMRDMVRLGGGLLPDKTLADDAWERALESLSKMGQRLRSLPHHAVRAVGTNTMRQIRDGGAFLKAAEDALGHPIEIIGGREEARLIYLGVAHGLAAGDERRLVVDIGGGSTETIIGEGLEPLDRESLFMGCVSMSNRFFAGGKITADAMEKAVLAGRVELRPIRRMFEAGRWQTAVGSSGTAKAIERVVVANGWSDEGITRSSLKKLRRALVAAGHIDDVKLEGLADERRPVFTGGVAVMSAVFKALDIERMQVSDLALREGLLYELVGYIQHVDIRDSTVSALMQRFGADRRQASRVESTARTLLKQVGESWQLNDPEHTLMLNWASRLHEIGLVISHGSFHKHGAYILANADLPGFTRQQQALLAALVRGHRRKIGDTIFAGLPANDVDGAKRLVVLLRLSTLMHRGRGGSHKPPIRLDASDKEVRVEFPEQWLVEHPLTEAEIVREAEYLSGIGFTLQYA
ncbi:MAG: Ppx/GppA family phosphatase [Chromatiaceae bacterium]|nr:Ppx/GppA family phosphatase [Gammaproteobacteria bacterium]MCP5306712.1 Ppx/GppA family phosphatase [Chromatiaceae bacterium]MCP5421786.1 Ppx/GppA family phosphatase [Chromatiaceae bacterium]